MVEVFDRHGVRFDPRLAGCSRFVRHSDYATLEKSLVEIEELLCAGQGDDNGMQIMPDFEPDMSTAAKVEDCLHLLEKRRDIVETQNARLVTLEAENARFRSGLQKLATSFYKSDQYQDYAEHVLGDEPLPARTEAAEARAAELEKALDKLLMPFEHDECRKDHHGYCQTHFLEEDCCVAAARRVREGGKVDG